MLVDASSSTPCEPSSDERPFDLQPAELAKALPTVASPRPQHHCPASIPSFWEPCDNVNQAYQSYWLSMETPTDKNRHI